MPVRHPRALVVTVLLAVLALVAGPALPAAAATSTGYVRLAHLSPDTAEVDVRLAPLSGSGGVVVLKNVAYGAVSDYQALPAGDYAVAMRPAGAGADTTPVVTASVRIKAGTAITVAVFGKNDDLQPKVIQDSLSVPPSGQARVRVIQASTAPSPVTVTAAGSKDLTVVDDASLASVSKYADVPAGAWKLQAEQGSTTSDATVDVGAGQVASLFVLENASGGLTIKPVLDAASVGAVPKGFVATGGGYLVHEQREEQVLLLGAAGALAVAAAGGGLAIARRRRRA